MAGFLGFDHGRISKLLRVDGTRGGRVTRSVLPRCWVWAWPTGPGDPGAMSSARLVQPWPPLLPALAQRQNTLSESCDPSAGGDGAAQGAKESSTADLPPAGPRLIPEGSLDPTLGSQATVPLCSSPSSCRRGVCPSKPRLPSPSWPPIIYLALKKPCRRCILALDKIGDLVYNSSLPQYAPRPAGSPSDASLSGGRRCVD